MRVLGLGLVALLSRAAAVDSCTQANSGSCCKGYTYNDTPLQLRSTAPVCDGSVPPSPGVTPPTCSGHDPVCTAIDRLPDGSFDGTLYCGNPLANTGLGTVKGTIHVEVGKCPSPLNGYCFILTATAPAGTTLKADFKVQISTSPLTSDNPGRFATKVTTQPVYVPFSLVYGTAYPCDTLGPKTVYIGFHAEEGTETCWAGGNDRASLKTIPGGNSNWALQFDFTYTCKEVCSNYCCCPAPPTVPNCPTDYTQSCQGKCDTAGAQCTKIPVNNLGGWGTSGSLYAEKCCCKPADDPPACTATSFTIRNTVVPGTLTCPAYTNPFLFCNGPVKGNIADCHTGLYNEACCCCQPTVPTCSGTKTDGACSANTPGGYTCNTLSDGCGHDTCCCTCTPDYSTTCAAPATHSSGACSGDPPSGYACTTKTDNCGNEFCCCTKNVCVPDYSSTCAAPATHLPGTCPASPPSGYSSCTAKTDNCGTPFCCCQPTVGTCTTGTAFGVPSDCAANTICDAAHYTGVITLKSKGCGRWGWVIDTGDLAAAGSKAYVLHQGGGGNDLSHGNDVGSVTIKHCTGSSTAWCAFYTTTGGNAITSAHVEADCDALDAPSTRDQNFPCAPGGYNDNGGNSCGANGLPGTSWTSQPFETCNSNRYFVILHAAVAKDDSDCTSTNCGEKDEGTGSS